MTHRGKTFWLERTEAYGRTSSNASMFRFLGQGGFDFAGRTVLEIGFGFGADLMEAQRRGATIYGIDISADAVRGMTERSGLEGRFRVWDITRDPLCFPILFDGIYSRDTINYFTDDEIGIFARHCRDALVPGGMLMVHFIQANYRRRSASTDTAAPVDLSDWDRLDGVFHPDNPIRPLDPEEVVRRVTAAGLSHTGKKTLWETYGVREDIMQCNRYLMFHRPHD